MDESPMTGVREQIEDNDDAAPVEMLAQLFEAHGWPCEFVNEDELCGEIQGSWTTYQLRCIWRPEDQVLQLLCLPEIRVSEDKMKAAYELLALVNEQIWLGHFDIWSQGGVLLYRHGLLLGEATLSLSVAQMAVDNAVSECDRFYPAFQFVLWGDKKPKDALASALVDAAGEA
ncbi:MAG: YbjN domain-containing protein [Croceibacterium sp.]